MKSKKYVYTQRNKFITTDETSIEGFIRVYEDLAVMFQKFKEKGVKLDRNSSIEDDYAEFYTTDPEVAKELGFEEQA